jgi:formylglycine-generating enzyme required for sulfatase activity
MRDLLDQTARDVQLASAGSQIPEVTTRGGAPRVCLSEDGCGGEIGLPSDATASDEATVGEVRALLAKLGFAANRGTGADALTDAIRQFQSRAGLPPDGRINATLLAVLRATASQVASLGPATGGDIIGSGPSEFQIGETFKDCESCPDMAVVPAGSFAMGAADGEAGRQPTELPRHEVRLTRPFAVSKHEITFDEWELCALEGGCDGYLPKDGGWGRGTRPAIFISWDDAKAYVEHLRQKTGKAYRLLTEAEWEYAARAGTTTPYSTGETITTAQADFDDSATSNRGDYEGKTVDVGSFPPNPYGLFDMHGNVWEWVEDCWNDSHAGAPGDGSARGGDCARRVLKGGAWYFEADYLRAASRVSYPSGSRLNVAGFRVARTLE